MKLKYSFICLIAVFILFFQQGLSAQHTNHKDCPSCQKFKRERLNANLQWGQQKTLNVNYNSRSDSFDVLNYEIKMNFDQLVVGNVSASCGIRFLPKLSGLSHISLDLLKLTVDSVVYQGSSVNFNYNDTIIFVQFPNAINVGDTSNLIVYYRGRPQSDASWGGFYFQNGYSYNLGVGFSANPHNFGRVWHPCFDNFVERATYEYEITTSSGKTSHCNGALISDQIIGSDRIRSWKMDEPIPTYLACIAVSNYSTVFSQYNGINGIIPIELVAAPADTARMKNSFLNLPSAIASYEYWFGPYRWNKVGYSAVPFNAGAMEHATNIAYPISTLTGNLAYETLMAHELSHHWWGDLTTCETAEDMWINEGMASYCEHLFAEYVYGWDRYISDVKANHYDVLLNAHVREGGYRPISGVPHQYTYGDHVYNKGASVAHNLRWYLGDSLFRQGMTAVLDSFGFNSVNSSQMRDFLTQRTGVDLNDFFNDWVFNGGFSHFELDAIDLIQNGSSWDANLRIQQKKLGNSNFHNNTPIQITFVDNNWNKYFVRTTISGEYDSMSVQLPFQPAAVILNEEHRLNQARMDIQHKVRNTGTLPMSTVRLANFNVTNVDSAFLHVEYHPVAPDSFINNPNGCRISKNRFWTINGVWNSNFNAVFRIEPDPVLDNDILLSGGYNSLILLYRPNPESDWIEHIDYTKVILPGLVFIRVDSIIKGDYALGSGQRVLEIPVSESKLKFSEIYPNPAKGQFILDFEVENDQLLYFAINDVQGREVMRTNLSRYQGKSKEIFNCEDLKEGAYFVNIKDQQGRNLAVKKLMVK
jgi:aminopeptidase N